MADTATSSRHILTFINIPADETNNLPIDDTTNNSPTDDTTNPLADDIIDDNDGFFFPGTDGIFTANHREFQLHRLTYKKVKRGGYGILIIIISFAHTKRIKYIL